MAAANTITRIDSPKLIGERKSRECFESTFVNNAKSPRSSRRYGSNSTYSTSSESLQKLIFENKNNNSCWTHKYEVENREYARGSYGKILLARDRKSRERVVIKQIPLSTPPKMINNEVKAGKLIGRHNNIASLIQYNAKADFHYLIFQFIHGQDLFSFLEKERFSPRTDAESRSVITQICKALKDIHSHNIAHRDIKLENVLFDPATGKVTLIDLGLCSINEDSTKLCREWCGSDNYIAPEIVRKQPYDAYKADVFSTGVVLFALLFGVFPFDCLRVAGSKMLRKLIVKFPTDVRVSESAKDLCLKMLEDDPYRRITMDEVLAHPWLHQDTAAEGVSLFSCFNFKTTLSMIN